MNKYTLWSALLWLVIGCMSVLTDAQSKKSTLTIAAPAEPTDREKVLHVFTFNDGARPFTSLVFDGAGNLYGTTFNGGNQSCSNGCGTIFELIPGANGKWTETVLHAFRGGDDGSGPSGSLIFDAVGNLYGTTTGSRNGDGTIFELAPGTDGKWTKTVLYAFHGNDGSYPYGALTLDSTGNLYGSTNGGGNYHACPQYGCGVVFKLIPNGNGQWTEAVLHRFNGNDGWAPTGALVFDGNGSLYGTTNYGGNFLHCGPYGCGTAFKLAPSANGSWTETVLHRFNLNSGPPVASLIIDKAGNLYGTSAAQGGRHYGTVFTLALGANGKWTETVIHAFYFRPAATPFAGVILDSAGNLYGTTVAGGTHGYGTVFKLAPVMDRKWVFSILHSFDGSDGNSSLSSLILDANGNLYGTTQFGGNLRGCSGNGCGVVFEITP
jgi:uncharacterized repeat protein (TIGR03803 family)